MKGIEEHEGKKYLRKIHSAASGESIHVDIYAVLEAFGVTCPARQHAIKKLLCAGNRQGHRDELGDLISADAALSRAIDLQRIRQGDGKERPLAFFDPGFSRTATQEAERVEEALKMAAKATESQRREELAGESIGGHGPGY